MTINHTIRIAAGKRVLVSIDQFEVCENRITILLGESGIGKSLAAKAVYGLLRSDDLDIVIDGKPYATYLQQQEVREMKANSFFVFQEPSTHLNPLMRLGEQLNEGSLNAAPNQQEILQTLFERSASKEIHGLLDVFPKPYRPSGGEKQRMLLAMAFKKIDLLLAKGKPESKELFVFDEPTGSLDNYYRDVFLKMLFERYRKLPFTILIITHDYSMIGRINETHSDLLSSIAFKELSMRGHGVALHDFHPKEYLRWLESLKPVHSFENVRPAGHLLTVDPHAKMFGRSLQIVRRNQRESPLTLRNGEMVYLKAPSGIGKTSIVKAVMGLLRAEAFGATILGLAVNEATPRSFWQRNVWGKTMTLIFQHADEALNLEATVKRVFTGLPSMRGSDDNAVVHLLEKLFDVELNSSFLNKKVKYLSGGQKQRLNLLRGLSLNTDILILDEPLNGLDFESGGKVVAMLQQMQKEGKGIVIISHNEEIFDRLVDEQSVYFLSAKHAVYA